MKKVYFLLAAICLHLISLAQKPESIPDTVRIGNMIIIKKGGKEKKDDTTTIKIEHHHQKPANLSTNWGIVDLGFTNYTDNTDYTSLEAQRFAPGGRKDWFNLRNGKSVNVNIW